VESSEVEAGLGPFIAQKAGARGVSLSNLVRLSGGASRETWTFDADIERSGGSDLLAGIFRADPARGIPSSPGRALEYHAIRAAWENGVVVPEPCWDGDDETFGVKFFVMKRVAGETLGSRLIRGEQYAPTREVLPAHLAVSLARIHCIDGDRHPELRGLPAPAAGVSPGAQEVANYEQQFRAQARNAHPVFELVFSWLHANLPPAMENAFVHGDYRLGNVIFDETGLKGVIDWELAHWGDPMEDIAWLMMRSWRFGGAKPVAGVGEREAFFRAYEEAGGFPIDRERLRFWSVFASLKWGVITVTQAERYLGGQSKSVELAAVGRRTAETEWELLDLLEDKED
jgi:aminoglycoside phosphotransferase (APT) family kinase protein